MSARPHYAKKYGQVFLNDPNIAKIEVNALSLEKTDTVLEIGPGEGILTDLLLKSGCKVIAVEADHRFVDILRVRYCREIDSGQLQVIKENFLDLPGMKVQKIIGNIPYMISSEIIFALYRHEFIRAVLMTQKEFATRMTARAGDKEYSRLSVSTSLRYSVKIVHNVSRQSFRPVPKVDSSIIMLTKKNEYPEDEILRIDEFTKKMFSNKRKMIRSILADCPEKFIERRPDSLSIEDIIEISRTASL
ncbi:MAG: 16S rRNA (adenine(1518)-N(6)/adenine(1519)-N(6))-dimethyltransferase RsmA [Thermoplasmata archaeon]